MYPIYTLRSYIRIIFAQITNNALTSVICIILFTTKYVAIQGDFFKHDPLFSALYNALITVYVFVHILKLTELSFYQRELFFYFFSFLKW